MSHFLKLISLALIWQKLGQMLHWATSRKQQDKSIDVYNVPDYRHYFRRFRNNMLIGLGIFVLAFLNRDTAFLKGIENEGIDTLMQIRQEIIPANPDIPPFVWLDIDNMTHQAWHMPMFTPRDKLHHLINTAVNAEARLIIVDIDLSRETPMEGLEKYTQGLAHHPYDQALFDYLENYATTCSPVCPPILLARTFQSSTASFQTLQTPLAFWMKRLKNLRRIYNGHPHYFFVNHMNIKYGISGYGNQLAPPHNRQ